MNKQFLEKLWKIREKIKLVTTERRNYLALEPNYYNKKFFTEHLLATETKKMR